MQDRNEVWRAPSVEGVVRDMHSTVPPPRTSNVPDLRDNHGIAHMVSMNKMKLLSHTSVKNARSLMPRSLKSRKRSQRNKSSSMGSRTSFVARLCLTRRRGRRPTGWAAE